MAEPMVFACEDLRRLIFSYLRTTAQINCHGCSKMLVWDRKIHPYFTHHHGKCATHYCYACWEQVPTPGCRIA